MTKKKFYNIYSGANVIKLFSLSLMKRPSKLECFCGSLLAWSNPSLLSNINKTCNDKHFALTSLLVSDKEECFITFTTGAYVMKLFSLLLMRRPSKLECFSVVSLKRLKSHGLIQSYLQIFKKLVRTNHYLDLPPCLWQRKKF